MRNSTENSRKFIQEKISEIQQVCFAAIHNGTSDFLLFLQQIWQKPVAKNMHSFDLLADLLQFDLLAHFLFHVTFCKLDRFCRGWYRSVQLLSNSRISLTWVFSRQKLKHENETKVFFFDEKNVFKMALVCTINEDVVLAVNRAYFF